MRRQKVRYNKYDWDILIFYDVDNRNTYEVIYTLEDIGCEGEYLHRAIEAVESCCQNGGITFARMSTRQMVVVIGKASDPKEFLNTFVHELHHMAEFIAREAAVPVIGEEVSYIAGDLSMLMHKEAGKLLCPHCNK